MRIIPIILSLVIAVAISGCKNKPANALEKDLPKTAGACTKEDVKLAINPNNHNFPKQMDECASSAMGNEKKTTKCLKTLYPNLSDHCASCFGKMASCSSSNCAFKCMFGHFSDGCLTCVNTNCRDTKKDEAFSLIRCTGLDLKQLPPSKPR